LHLAAPIRGTTQQFIDIESIRDDLVILKDGSASLILETSAVNFGLLSEREQDALIYAFAAFLNSLSFPIQVLITSRKMDITSYLELINQQIKKQSSEKIKDQTRKYYQFIQSIVQENEVLEKRFFIVVPFTALELGIKSGLAGIGKTPKKLPYPINYIVKRAQTALFPKRDHVTRQLSRMGLSGQQLTTDQLIELFYTLFNLQASEQEKVIGGDQYTQAIVSG
jgi:hypothetical protein